jgi:predicted ABC-type ATPase
MIISLRGTSGSGKSSLVRRVTRHYEGGGVPHFVDGRRRAYYTTWSREPRSGTSLAILGHYDIANGGVDTLGTLDEAYDLARHLHGPTRDVIMEGKCMSDGVTHVSRLRHSGQEINVVHINTPVDQCIESVRKRGHNIAEDSIRRTNEKILRDMETIRGFCHTFTGDREQCYRKVTEWLAL